MIEKKQYTVGELIKELNKRRTVYSTTNANVQNIVDKLNSQEERIKELEEDLNDALNRIEERSIDVQLLKKENENLNNVLEDFMVMLNRLQANPDNEVLQSMAKDMLRMMGKGIMGDAND